ncbi:DUF1963 domain-containing protein [uncultured Paludibaculum sp.]|uniref:DUF1963 domain-containing protein n=1 Tax=uncultured Paludibaculum sp. TaxID=1765020 RepID=UPI002AAAB9FB|nr:DUF1963 domain-containing protein [uncultured Paludibaculum sp.]
MEYGRLVLARAESPINLPITKLGGLPVWVEDPAWPVSRATGELMLFLGQVALNPRLFPAGSGRIAYLFMTGGEPRDLATWDPDSGENAVVIQNSSPGRAPTIIEGPRLVEAYWVEGVARWKPLELAATVCIEEDRPEIPCEEVSEWPCDRRSEYYGSRSQRVSGTPDWIQDDAMPAGWQLLLQVPDYPRVDGDVIQTNWNFGTGVCYAMISPDCTEGIIRWQCG